MRHATIARLALALVIAFPFTAAVAEPKHGLSIFGNLKYAADFKHFDYVNPDAPKGGRIVTMGTGGAASFDSFNNFIVKGDAAQGLDFLFDTLMVRAADEPDAMYGLVAKSADVAADGKSVTFKLRGEAKFSDGTAITSADVVNSFTLLKEKGAPAISMALRDVVKAEAPDAETVVYAFQGQLTRDLPIMLASLPVLSKAYYTTRPFEETSLEAPLGSGPYLMKDFKAGAFVAYKRREDYWAKDLPVNHRPLELRRNPLRLLSRSNGAARSDQVGRARPAGRVHQRRLGDELQRARGHGRPADPRSAARRKPLRRARVLSSIRDATSSRTFASARRSTMPSTSNGRTRSCSIISTRAPAASLKTPT